MTFADTPKLRGMWVDVFHEGIKTPSQVRELIARAKRANVNALFIQVRSRAQVYHVSRLEPRAPDTLPWFDGLAAVIREARSQDPPIQVHAWINAHPFWSASVDPPWPYHPLFRHSDWLTRNPEGGVATDVGRGLDFGHPEAQEYLLRLYLEVVRNYDVDGIHLDFIRFAGKEWGYNPKSLERFYAHREEYSNATAVREETHAADAGVFPGADASRIAFDKKGGAPAPDDPAWSAWRRDQVTTFVRRLVLHAKALKPNLMVSAAVIPWGDAPSDFRASAAYTRCFQDWKAWAEEGLLDLLLPMLYFREPQHGDWYRNWVRYCRSLSSRTPIAAGIGNYLNSHDDTMTQCKIADENLSGVCFFSYASTNPYPGLEAEVFNERFYDRVGNLPPAPPLSANRSGIVRETVSFGYRFDDELEPIGSKLGLYVDPNSALPDGMAEVARSLGIAALHLDRFVGRGATHLLRLSSVHDFPAGKEFVLTGLEVIAQESNALVVRDRLTGEWVRGYCDSMPDPPYAEGDVVAVLGVRDERGLRFSRVRWTGVSPRQ